MFMYDILDMFMKHVELWSEIVKEMPDIPVLRLC